MIKFILQLCLSVGIILLLATAYRATSQQLSFSDINHTDVVVFYTSALMTLSIATVLLVREGKWRVESEKKAQRLVIAVVWLVVFAISTIIGAFLGAVRRGVTLGELTLGETLVIIAGAAGLATWVSKRVK